MIRTRVLLLCGGQSEEHEVSIASARSVLGAAGERFDITPLVVDRTGTLLDQANSLEALQAGGAGPHGASGGQLATLPSGFDVVFPLLHGPNGEDGSVQGLLQLAGLPHVGSGVLASAVGMDKIVMKQLFDGLGLPQVVFEGVTEHAWTTRPAQVMTRLDRLGYPVFVKPANLGSSVGISKAQDRDGLRSGLDLAFGHDRRAIVEQAASGARELEVAVLGNDAPEASPVGEITFASEFYNYDTKYQEGRADLHIPAPIPAAVADRCRTLAVAAFAAIDAAGLARVDFFYVPETDSVLVNEINTIPGFTRTSMYPKLWQAAGIDYPDLVDRLLTLALERSCRS